MYATRGSAPSERASARPDGAVAASTPLSLNTSGLAPRRASARASDGTAAWVRAPTSTRTGPSVRAIAASSPARRRGHVPGA